MIEVDLDPATRQTDPHYKRKLREAKRACKEAAGWQCEWVHPNGKRCAARQGQLRRKKGRHGEPDSWSVMHLHGCHVGNKQVAKQQFICLCPRHHAEYDRGIELQEQLFCYRCGYQITSTDALLEEVQEAGISVWEEPNGYHWRVDGTELRSRCTTAVSAVCAAIRQMSSQWELVKREVALLKKQIAALQTDLRLPGFAPT
jgi:hypothetical protein